jgi:chromosome segregation ATPase
VLGERELDLATVDRALGHARAEHDRLQAEIASLDQELATGKTALGAMAVKAAALQREQSKSAGELERSQSALAKSQTQLAGVEAKLDKALLAQGVAELTASQTALRQEVASLDADLARKRPLFHQSVNVNQKLLGLDEQLRSLSIQRDKLTAELQALVAELGQVQPGHAADTNGAAAESLAKLTGN